MQNAEQANELVSELRAFGFEYGFEDSNQRYQAYEIMLGISVDKFAEASEILNNNKDCIINGTAEVDQIISNDSNRSFVHFEDHKDFTLEVLNDKKRELKTILYTIVQQNPTLSYYQGLNFIAELFYVEYGLVRAYLIVEALVRFMFSDYMGGNKSFDAAIVKKTNYAYIMLKNEIKDFDYITDFNVSTQTFTKDATMQKLSFAVSWIITFFAYKLNSHKKILEIFDFLVCSLNPYGISYLVAAIILEIFDKHNIGKSTDHHITMELLYNGNFNSLEIRRILDRSFILMNKPDYQLDKLDKSVDNMHRANAFKHIGGRLFNLLKR